MPAFSPMLWTIALLFAFTVNCNASRYNGHNQYLAKLGFRQTSSNSQNGTTHNNSSHHPVSFVQSTGDDATAGFAVLPPGTVANSSLADLTAQCINAMESTVQCDDNLNSLAAADYYMEVDATNLQSICSQSCSTSLAAYNQNVASACAGEPEAWSGYPATYFGNVLWASWNMTCLSDPTTGQSCMAYYFNISSNYTSDLSATTLPQDVLCSPCVLSMYQMFQQTAYSYYDSNMAADWENIQSQCGVSYPTSVPENPTNVTNIPGFPPQGAGSTTAPTPTCFSGNTHTVASGEGCIGISQQYNVSTGTLQILNNIFPDCSNLIGGATLCLPNACQTYTVQSNDTCQGITNSSSISFTQFSSWNPSINTYCTNLIAGQEVCVGQPGTPYNGTTIAGATGTQTAIYATATVPPPSNIAKGTTSSCGKYYTMQSGDDCSLIVLNNTISLGLFESINPSVNSDCSNLIAGLAYCVFPTANWTDTSGGNTTSTYVTAPAPTPTGTTGNCYEYHTIVTNDYCGLLENQYDITFEQLQSWNPTLNAACSNLILGDAYCVQGDTTGSGGGPTSIPTGTTPGGPTQTGITSGCQEYYTVQNQDGCETIESTFDVTFQQLFAWNPAIGSNCNFLIVGDSICVLGPVVSSSSTTTTTAPPTSTSSMPTSTTVTPGAPTQSGIVAGCMQYYTVKSGDGCAAVETTLGVTFAQLYSWNPALGSNCQYLVIGDAICVSGPAPSSTQVTPPGPTQSGIVANCNEYYLVQSGDGCASIESKYGITFTQLETWNPAIGSNCEFLDVGDAYCVGVSS